VTVNGGTYGTSGQGSPTIYSTADSKIITNKGDTFYVTNTAATINLTNNAFTNNDATGAFLRIAQGPWGTSGSNGGDVTMNLKNQSVEGDICVDTRLIAT
jgi:hypothetical protein